ncbi:hypothetical protein [Modestobacter lacusdianchii]
MPTRVDEAATSGTRWLHVLASDGDVLAAIEQQIVDAIHARTSDVDTPAFGLQQPYRPGVGTRAGARTSRRWRVGSPVRKLPAGLPARTCSPATSALIARAVTSRSSPQPSVPRTTSLNEARQALAEATAVVDARVQLLPVLDIS